MTFFGIQLDGSQNQQGSMRISTDASKVEVVVETNEELMIVRDTYNLI